MFWCGVFLRKLLLHDFAYWTKTLTMLGANAVLFECGLVGFCAITDMFFKTVFRVFLGDFYHVIISGNFGDD